jgi:hypothetical protein
LVRAKPDGGQEQQNGGAKERPLAGEQRWARIELDSNRFEERHAGRSLNWSAAAAESRLEPRRVRH